jgi:N utilization substance protein B
LDLVRQFIDESAELPVVTSAAHQLLADTLACQDDCDRLLARHAKHWDLSRLALVDRNILRLAASELRTAATPPKVVISEAIQLAREFSTSESPRFVNGVLDAMMREIQAASPQQGSPPQQPTEPLVSPNPQSAIHNPQSSSAGEPGSEDESATCPPKPPAKAGPQ